jgi:hypothetical protein
MCAGSLLLATQISLLMLRHFQNAPIFSLMTIVICEGMAVTEQVFGQGYDGDFAEEFREKYSTPKPVKASDNQECG